jgi:hypothetical protein
MRNTATSRRSLAAVTVAVIAISAIASGANAQSEFMRGDRMPYAEFDKLPKTDLDVPGGTIHVAFAPGDIILPKERVLDWVRTSAKAVTAYYGPVPPFVSSWAATPQRMSCGATG